MGISGAKGQNRWLIKTPPAFTTSTFLLAVANSKWFLQQDKVFFSFFLTKSIHLIHLTNFRILICHPFTAPEANADASLSICPYTGSVTCLALSWAGLGSQGDYMDNQLLRGLVPWTRSTRAWQAAGLSQGRMWEGQCTARTLPVSSETLVEKSHSETLTLIICMSLLYFLKCTTLDSSVLFHLVNTTVPYCFSAFQGFRIIFFILHWLKSEVLCRATKGHKFTTAPKKLKQTPQTVEETSTWAPFYISLLSAKGNVWIFVFIQM